MPIFNQGEGAERHTKIAQEGNIRSQTSSLHDDLFLSRGCNWEERSGIDSDSPQFSGPSVTVHIINEKIQGAWFCWNFTKFSSPNTVRTHEANYVKSWYEFLADLAWQIFNQPKSKKGSWRETDLTCRACSCGLKKVKAWWSHQHYLLWSGEEGNSLEYKNRGLYIGSIPFAAFFV